MQRSPSRRAPRALHLALAALLVGLGPLARAEEAEDPLARQPFLGLSVRDTPQGLVVGWIQPGPLGGRGFDSRSGIRRGDNVVSVDGAEVDAAGLRARVAAKRPGESVRLALRRSPEAQMQAAVPRGGPGGEPFEVNVTLGSRAEWTGTIGRGLGGREIPPPKEGALEALVLEEAARLGVREGLEEVGGALDALLAYLGRVQEEGLDPNALPAVVNAFRRPLSVDAVEAEVAAAAHPAAAGDPGAIEAFVRLVLDLPAEAPEGTPSHAEAAEAIRAAGTALAALAREHRPDAERLVRRLRESVDVYDDDADGHVRTVASLGTRAPDVLAQALVLLRHAPAWWIAEASAFGSGEPIADLPPAVRAAVEGDVLWVGEDPLGGLAVVGGPGANRYDMARVAMVYDPGGDDRYVYGAPPAPPGSPAPPVLRVVVDLGGNDVHESEAPFEGPATAAFGLSWLEDRGGSDVYRTEHAFGVGAGLLGFGVLLDRAGDDVYESVGPSSGWGIGAGFWGAGLVVDVDGHDVYRGERLVQGVGGPRGLGAVLDRRGSDLYRANGPSFGSVYGTPAVYVGMSQGFGIGVRGYAAGGVGAIYDLEGNDRYEAGEFSQAGGYYFGMGVLHDAAGDDLYYGNRYGQAFAAHQAVGVLVDDAGNDTYWSMTAASQAGTWDQSIGLLLDRGGDDAYRCDGLGQGAAAMQALAILVDLAGNDRYAAAGGAVQGQSGSDSYHYDADRVFSFSALLDLGSGHDTYSAPRENDTTVPTGRHDPSNPAESSLYGLFLDR